MTISVHALVVTYEPDEPQLDRLLGVLAASAIPTTVADNGSANLERVRAICARHGAAVVGGTTNQGIPARLNEILESTTAAWILYLDQDSGISQCTLERLLARLPKAGSEAEGSAADPEPIGLVCPAYRQVSTGRSGYSDRHLRRAVRTPIGSGSLYRRSACLAIGGFSELFPLDLGDFDTALRLQDQGYRVQIETDVVVEHQVGNRLPARGVGQPEMHSAWRYFLKADGTRRMAQRHGIRHPLWVSKLFVARIVEVIRSWSTGRDNALIAEFGRGLFGLKSSRVPHDLLLQLRTKR